jgi:cation diffusion facilitator CzcD-associated flavoprotein CzcO
MRFHPAYRSRHVTVGNRMRSIANTRTGDCMKLFDMDDIPVLIIGAGISGLGAAQELTRRGISCCILDAEAESGVPWRKRHPQLTLNTHRKLSQLPGLAMPESAGDFLHRDTVVEYVQRYAANLGVPIRYGCRVTGLRRVDAGWHVETSEGPMFARDVVIATGRDREPVIPNWLGREDWGGRLIHAHDLGEIGQYRGKHVLVVGAGNSGMDVLNHLAGTQTASLSVSVGFPLLRLSPFLSRLPVWLLDPLLTGVGRLLYGDLRRHGLTRHANGGAKRLLRTGVAPAIDNGAIAALKQGRIRVVSAISRFREHDVELVDGLRIAPDVVIAATGYTAGLGEMLRGFDLLDARGFPVINGGEQHPSAPGLWFTGMRPGLTGFFHASTVTGRAIARGIEAAVRTDRATAPDAARPVALRESGMELAVDRLLSADAAASTSREV